MEKQTSFRNPVIEKQHSFRNGGMEKQKSFKGLMEKQKSFKGLMEKQKSFRIAMERQMSFGGDRKKSKDSPGKRGDTPLHLAARGGNLGKVKEIIQKFESINNGVMDLLSKQNQEGETPLYVAAENGHVLVVGEFLKHSDAEICAIPAHNGYDPFHVAAKQGHLGEYSIFNSITSFRKCYSFCPLIT